MMYNYQGNVSKRPDKRYVTDLITKSVHAISILRYIIESDKKIKEEIVLEHRLLTESEGRFRLNPDSASSRHTTIIRFLNRILQTSEFVSFANRIYESDYAKLSKTMPLVQRDIGAISWLFSDKKHKQRVWDVISQMDRLNSVYSNSYYDDFRNRYARIIDVCDTEPEPWTDFLENTAPYYALIEKIVGVDKTEDDYFGIKLSSKPNTPPKDTKSNDVSLAGVPFRKKPSSSGDDVQKSTPVTTQERTPQNTTTSPGSSSNQKKTDAKEPNQMGAGESTAEIPQSNYRLPCDYSKSHSQKDDFSRKCFDFTVEYQHKDRPRQRIGYSYYDDVGEDYENYETEQLKREVANLMEEVKKEDLKINNLKSNLRGYQLFGAKYILHQGNVLLGDEMGLGKTVEAIAVMAHLAELGKTHFLVVCPLSVVENWSREVVKHSRLTPRVIYGKDKEFFYKRWIRNGGVGITNYESLKKLEVPDIPIHFIVFDEAHSIKNPDAQKTWAAHEYQDKSERTLYMSGTPLENHVSEMIYLIKCLQRDVAYSVSARMCTRNPLEYRLRIAPAYLRRVREDVLQELPDKVETEEWSEMNSTELDAYRNALVYEPYMTIRRFAWAVPSDKSSKMKRLREICEEAKGNGRKVLIFSYFISVLETVKHEFSSDVVGMIYGKVPNNERQSMIDRFNKAPGGSILLSQITSGGQGLNIQAASVVVLCEPQFKPSTENQAISRAYRFGQARTVFVHRLLLKDTIDENLMRRLASKQKAFDAYADKSSAGEENISENALMSSIVAEELKKYGLARSADAKA